MTRDASRPPERFARVAAAVRDEMALVGKVVDEARRGLVTFGAGTPNAFEVRGIADVVHDFYTGAERIFEKVAPELNGGVPAGPGWHRELLRNMTLDLPGIRPPLLRPETERTLERYLRFRHRFRNLYGFELDWAELQLLLRDLPPAWEALRRDLDAFLSFLDAAARSG